MRPLKSGGGRRPLKHWLITFAVASDVHMHAYLVSSDKRQLMVAMNRMLDEAEKTGCRYPLRHMILVTPLSKEIERVREIIGRRSAEVKVLLASVTDYHFSAWTMHSSDADDITLMGLH